MASLACERDVKVGPNQVVCLTYNSEHLTSCLRNRLLCSVVLGLKFILRRTTNTVSDKLILNFAV